MTQADSLSTRRHEAASFPVRRMDFDFSRSPQYGYADNPLASCFWLVLQALFPDGEQFFIDSVRSVREKIEDPQLQRDISAFIGQEAMHGRAHREANAALLKVHGIDVVSTERRTKQLMALFTRLHTPMQRLAMTAGAEHLTSTIARFLLRHPDYLAGFRDPVLRRLVMWHALEEREHRAVAYDVYQQAGGGYWTRATMFPWFMGLLAPFVTYDIVKLMLRHGGFRDRHALRLGFASLLGRKGLLQKIGPGLRDYFRRDFHPRDDDQSALEAEWRRELALAT